MGGSPVYLDDNGEEYLDENGETISSKAGAFPGMPQGLKAKAAPDYSTFLKPESSFNDVESAESVPDLEPPQYLRRPPNQPPRATEGLNFGQDQRSGNPFLDAAMSEGVPDATNLEDAGSNLATGATIMAAGGGIGALGLARAGGAVTGAQLGYKKGGIPGAVMGGVTGAVAPGATTMVDLAEMVGGDPAALAVLPVAFVAKKLGIDVKLVPAAIKQFIAATRGAEAVEGAANAASSIPKVVEGAQTAARVSEAAAPAANVAKDALLAERLAKAAQMGQNEEVLMRMAREQVGDRGPEFVANALAGSKGVPQQVAAAAKEAEIANALKVPREASGARRVGREVGMTQDQVRAAAGPVLDEAVGAASPILPKEVLKQIIDKMRPLSMAEREAYVAAATSGKTKAQVENVRRTLEHLGLLVPVGVGAGMLAAEGS